MSNPKPGDFPIGSALSRAAARMLLKNQRDTRKRIQMVTNAFFAEDEAGRPLDTSKPLATPWTGNAETLVRILCVPDGMTKEEAMRIVDRMN
jgi:hypothetical protein